MDAALARARSATKMDRGCVEDQPQDVDLKQTLRLVFDTAALRNACIVRTLGTSAVDESSLCLKPRMVSWHTRQITTFRCQRQRGLHLGEGKSQ